VSSPTGSLWTLPDMTSSSSNTGNRRIDVMHHTHQISHNWKVVGSLVILLSLSVFIYSMTGYSCSIKERMLYSSLRTSHWMRWKETSV
jgi:hypothetical protein